jgi:hypothetical protein
MGLKMIHRGTIIYENKNTSMTLEFDIKFDEARFKKDMAKAKQIAENRRKPAMTKRICASPYHERAKWCPVQELCFNDFALKEKEKVWAANG